MTNPRQQANSDALCLRMLAAIHDYRRKHGYSPTIRELCRITGITSTGELTYCRDKIIRRGWITHSERQARTMRVTRDGLDILREMRQQRQKGK